MDSLDHDCWHRGTYNNNDIKMLRFVTCYQQSSPQTLTKPILCRKKTPNKQTAEAMEGSANALPFCGCCLFDLDPGEMLEHEEWFVPSAAPDNVHVATQPHTSYHREAAHATLDVVQHRLQDRHKEQTLNQLYDGKNNSY